MLHDFHGGYEIEASGVELFDRRRSIIDHEALTTRMGAGDGDILFRCVERGDGSPQPRQGFGQQARAASHIQRRFAFKRVEAAFFA